VEQRNPIPACDGAIRKEEDPDPVPPVPILSNNLLLVAHPVLVPAVDCSGVVNTKNVNVLDLKTSTFQLFWSRISNPPSEEESSDKPC
jgi:hypothetical protein